MRSLLPWGAGHVHSGLHEPWRLFGDDSVGGSSAALSVLLPGRRGVCRSLPPPSPLPRHRHGLHTQQRCVCVLGRGELVIATRLTLSLSPSLSGERGHSLLSTSTTVLLCNLSLQPGDSRSGEVSPHPPPPLVLSPPPPAVVYSELIPSGGPPTLSGRLVKYAYKLAVGAQKPGCPARIIRVPFRVRVIPAHLCSNQAVPSPADTNPFLRAEVSEDPTFDLALQALAAETSRRSASACVP